MRIRFLSTFVLFLVSLSLSAQTTQVLDNLPPSTKWYQLKTPHFKIIYPQGFSVQGQRMANTMEHIYQPVAKSLGDAPKKNFPLILQNQNAVANGFVTIGPWRSEFYTMSPQRANLLGNNDWLDLLALHEYRHVIQYNKSRTGLTGFVRNIFGEFSHGAIANAVVPTWFWEGDAVGVETSLSASGRGRIPYFSAAFRANLLEKGSFNYNKQYLGSFKDFVPNHYVLGYHYTTYLKNEYGVEAMAQMANRAWALPFIPFGFSLAQNKYAGKKMPAMYQAMMAQLKEKWTNQLAEVILTPYSKINLQPKKVYTNYDYPQILDNGNILVIKSGLDDIDKLVEIDINTGKEEEHFIPGILNDAGILSARGSLVVWNEYEFDLRWRQKAYSVVRTYNLATGYYNELTKGSRYSSAALSPDRSYVATVEALSDYKSRIAILDAYSGLVIHLFDANEGSTYITPVWTSEQKLVVSEVRNSTKQIKEIDITTGKEEVLLPATEQQISFAVRKENYLYYVSGWSGIDNIYAKDLTTDVIYQVTSAKYGAYNPVISDDGRLLYYNDFTQLGTDVVKIDLLPDSWVAVKSLKDTDIHFYQPMAEMEDNKEILSTIPEVVYDEKRYRKKLLKFHSWGPYIANTQNELEAGIYSTNVLSTSDLFVGFHVDTDANFKWISRVSYQSLYPIIDVEVNYAKRNSIIHYRDTTALLSDRQVWDETGVKAGLRIPWLLTSNRFHTNLLLQNYFGLTKLTNFKSDTFGRNRHFLSFGNLSSGSLRSNEFKLIFSSLLKRSKRDIQSKFGSVFIFENFSTPYGGEFKGGLTAFKTQLYFPGFVKHHSINLFAGYQHNKYTLDNNNYWFPNRMPYPRSVTGGNFEDLYVLRFNYELPLLTPDFSLGPWLYFQRIKAKLFYDYGHGSSNVKNSVVSNVDNKIYELALEANENLFSTGAELTFEFNVMRALPMLELGVRFAYLPDLGESKFEFLIGSLGF